MNYIKQLNVFRGYLAFHDLPPTAILLWHTLMLINNMTGWRRRFSVPYALIQQYGGLSKQRLSDARKILVEHGLIRYEKGKKGRAPVYEMVVLTSADKFGPPSQNTWNTPTEIVRLKNEKVDVYPDLYADQFQDQSRNILKHKHKQKRRRGEGALQFFHENFATPKPAICKTIQEWCEMYTEELVLEAMHVSVINGGKTLKYIKKVLWRWEEAGVKEIEEVRKFEKEKVHHSRPSLFSKENVNSGNLFDELREELII